MRKCTVHSNRLANSILSFPEPFVTPVAVLTRVKKATLLNGFKSDIAILFAASYQTLP